MTIKRITWEGLVVYEYIKGIFIGINKDYVVIDNNGIGYKIFTSGSTFSNMPKVNDSILLYIQQIVREDFIGLYGFLTKDEINMFNLLLTVSGIGAKAALSMLSINTVGNLKYAILTGDEKNLMKAPGIGKKTAQRIILELKDKINVDEINRPDVEIMDVYTKDSNNSASEASEALLSLGYSEKEVEKALNAVSQSDSVELIIKNCLKFLMN